MHSCYAQPHYVLGLLAGIVGVWLFFTGAGLLGMAEKTKGDDKQSLLGIGGIILLGISFWLVLLFFQLAVYWDMPCLMEWR